MFCQFFLIQTFISIGSLLHTLYLNWPFSVHSPNRPWETNPDFLATHRCNAIIDYLYQIKAKNHDFQKKEKRNCKQVPILFIRLSEKLSEKLKIKRFDRCCWVYSSDLAVHWEKVMTQLTRWCSVLDLLFHRYPSTIRIIKLLRLRSICRTGDSVQFTITNTWKRFTANLYEKVGGIL